jgi:tetratricopeptide (TPR) repeat protein
MKIIHTTIIFLFFICTKVGLSQNIQIDSLKAELQNRKEKDTTYLKLLINLADLHVKKNLNSTLNYAEQSIILSDSLGALKEKARSFHIKGIAIARHLSINEGLPYYLKAAELYKTLNYKRGSALCYNNLGIAYFNNGDYNQAIKYYSKAAKLREEIGLTNGYIKALFYIGLAYGEKGDYHGAVENFKKGLKASEDNNNLKQASKCLTALGNVYSHQGNYPLALEYHNRALAIAKKEKDDISISDALMSIGNVHIRLENFNKAIELHSEALKISKNNNDKNTASILNNLGEIYMSKKNYKKAHTLFNEALTKFSTKGNVGICLNNIANVYLAEKEYDTALQKFEKAKQICLSVENQRGLCDSFLGIAQVYFLKKKYDKALSYALKSRDLSNKLELVDVQKNGQQLLSKIYEKKGLHKKALESYQQYKILNDSLFNKKNIEKLAQLEADYKYKQALDSANIRELELTNTVSETNKNLVKTQRNYLWAVIGVLLISMVLGSVIFYQKLNHAKSKTQRIITEQKLLRSQMTPHFIFNSLSVLQGMILNKEEKKSVSYLSKFSKLMRITLENSRDKLVLLSHELFAVEHYLSLQNLENETYQYNITVNDSIDSNTFLVPPMLIQPFVENAIEHAFKNQQETKSIAINLNYSNENLICTITDNGIGIDAQKGVKNGNKISLSTAITSERLKIISKDLNVKGWVTIEDRQKYEAQGTLVTLVIPYKLVEAQ